MSITADRFIDLLLHRSETVAIVGTGSQAQGMRRYLHEQLRLRLEDLGGFSSIDAPTNRELYVLCATPQVDAAAALAARGVPQGAIVSWAELYREIESTSPFPFRRLGLSRIDASGRQVLPPIFRPGFDTVLDRCELELRGLLVPERPWSDGERQLLETLSAAYLLLRRQRAALHSAPLKRLLFPSPGRCGGISLTNALRAHPRLHLRVDHEGLARAIYWMLALYRQKRLSAVPLVATASVMLDEFDCLGGNPFCFLVPYLQELPWFECYILKVERPATELRESIVQRNFHYSPADFVPERITGAAWGDMDVAAWSRLSLESKVDWYIAKVDAEIERGISAVASITRTPLARIEPALYSVLERMGWPTLASVPHLNALPKDRIYSYDERIRMFHEQRNQETVGQHALPSSTSG